MKEGIERARVHLAILKHALAQHVISSWHRTTTRFIERPWSTDERAAWALA